MWKEIKYCSIIFLIFTFFSTSFGLNYSVKFPEEVKVGEWFNVTVYLESNESENVQLYSYVFKGLNCISQGWTVNKKEIHLEAGEKKTIILEDMIKKGSEEGIYKIRIKIKYDNLTLNETSYIKVKSSSVEIETYLYSMLVLLSITGLILFFKFNK